MQLSPIVLLFQLQAASAIDSLWRNLRHQHNDVSFEREEWQQSRMPVPGESWQSQPCIAKLVQGKIVAHMKLPAAHIHQELLAAQVLMTHERKRPSHQHLV